MRRRVWVVPMALAVAAVSAVQTAGAQQPADADATTTTRPLPLPLVPATTSTTAAPTTTAPPDGPGAGPEAGPDEQEVGADEPPPTDVTVPAPATPAPPPANGPAVVAGLRRQLRGAVAAARAADGAVARSTDRLRALEHELVTTRAQLATAEAADRRAVHRLNAARRRLRERAVGAYTGNATSTLNQLLSAGDVNDMLRRSSMVETVLRQSRKVVAEYRDAERAAGGLIARLVDETARTESAIGLAQDELARTAADALDARVQADALAAGSAIAVKGFVFPIAAPHRFGNDFGNPRMTGTPLAHAHQGTDVFAAYGAPVVAVERGVVTRVGNDRLGGIKLWLVGQSGTRYYYAHMSAYAPGIANGLVVEAGTLLGFVGTSGNAQGTSPHTHFQVHPGGGAPVNPYFLLRAASDAGAMAAPPTATPAP